LEEISLGSINWVRTETGGLSPRHIMRMSAEGKFPKPVRVTEGSENRRGRIAFVKSEVRAWIAARIAERDAKIAASIRAAPQLD
jgi:predicted DNA-binding transcriptional regulator AlpA